MRATGVSRARQTIVWWLALVLAACRPAEAAVPVTATPSATLPPVVVVVASDTPAAHTPTEPHPTATLTPGPSATVVTPSVTAAPPSATPLRPTPDAGAAGRRVRLPILMYHYVEPWPAGADVIRQGLTVKPEDFAAQMAYLHEHGYVTVSLYDLLEAVAQGTPLPEKAVALTFDDGYRTLLDYAVPVLQPYGYTGTVFVITQFMDEARPEYLTWAQAEALYAQGWKIEPHTKTHDNLKGRGRDFQLYQMLGSAQTVEAHIGAMPRFLAYPSGQYDALSVELAAEMNLWGAVTTVSGRNHTWAGRYEWTRVRVNGDDLLQDFINGLEGGA
ncbi:MAG: polysaccharide deacetylase family protein [Anaerolineales bacterium]|nr:polysaccharide deacetylase family protein [Anaerolineales bacterium]